MIDVDKRDGPKKQVSVWLAYLQDKDALVDRFRSQSMKLVGASELACELPAVPIVGKVLAVAPQGCAKAQCNPSDARFEAVNSHDQIRKSYPRFLEGSICHKPVVSGSPAAHLWPKLTGDQVWNYLREQYDRGHSAPVSGLTIFLVAGAAMAGFLHEVHHGRGHQST